MSDGDATITVPQHAGHAAPRKVRFVVQVHPEPAADDATHGWHPVTGARLVIGRQPDPGLRLDDPHTSRRHAELVYITEFDRYRLKDCESHNGTFLDGHRVDAEYLRSGAVVRVGDTLLVYVEAVVPAGVRTPTPERGVSIARALVEQQIELVAPSRLPVLVLGPTGAGKELLARRLHARSGRRGKLVSLNCATLPRELVASELFGHVRNAFSGAATAREGLFVTAAGGTLFLDEIADLPADQQPTLLRALQDRCIRPVGADREVPVDVRVVAATHRDLPALSGESAFRADLFGRLAGVTLTVPGLAARREEVLHLFGRFLDRPDLPWATEAAQALLLYGWPGNVRELEHVAALVRLGVAGADRFEVHHLPAPIRDALPAPAPEEASGPPDEAELAALLQAHGGNVSRVATELGRPRQTVYRWLQMFGMDPARFRDG